MIDSHCHLEQKRYDNDRDEVIEKCREDGIRAIITSCAHPRDLEKTIGFVEKYKNFVFAVAGIHPLYIKEISPQEIDDYFKKVTNNQDRIVGIGEIGLDHHWIKEDKWREKQEELFVRMLNLSKELNKPVVIHSREALGKTLDILEREGIEKVCLHMWGGHTLMERVNNLEYHISMNSIVMRSKNYRAVAKRTPLKKLMLETDAPWLGIKRADDGYSIDPKIRNDSRTIKLVAQKIAELRKVGFEEIWKECGENSIRFFGLPIKI